MDAKGIINQGLRLLGSYAVNSIQPASSPLERQCAEGYPQWKASELTRRRWVFNNYSANLVAGSAPHATALRPNAFDLPNDCLAPVRKKADTWVQKGRKIYTWQSEMLDFEYKANVAEEVFDILFNDVLAYRVAEEMVEWVTQSNVKKADILAMYRRTIATAAANNALIIGAEDSIHEDDSQDSWIAGRYGVGL